MEWDLVDYGLKLRSNLIAFKAQFYVQHLQPQPANSKDKVEVGPCTALPNCKPNMLPWREYLQFTCLYPVRATRKLPPSLPFFFLSFQLDKAYPPYVQKTESHQTQTGKVS